MWLTGVLGSARYSEGGSERERAAGSGRVGGREGGGRSGGRTCVETFSEVGSTASALRFRSLIVVHSAGTCTRHAQGFRGEV